MMFVHHTLFDLLAQDGTMSLADFFAPLTWQVVFWCGLLFVAWDLTGSIWAFLFKLSPVFRPAYWVLGLGTFVAFWFVAHFWLPFSPQLTWASVAVMAGVGLPFALVTRSWRSLFAVSWRYPFFWLLVIGLGFVKPFFYHASLPPRVWDDMAYHFYPPYQVFLEPKWDFTSNMITGELSFYGMLPRLVDTAYVLGFSLTRTYATAQVIHLGLVMTALWTTSIFLSKRVGYLSGVVFSWLSLGLNTGILLSATTGYVDAAAGALALLVLVALGEWVVATAPHTLLPIAAFAGMAVGTKYTNIIFPVVGFSAASCIQGLQTGMTYFRRRLRLPLWNSVRQIGLWLSLMIVVGTCFGGYWYLKNLAVARNPFYPFVFGCAGCREEQNVLDDWGYAQFTQENQELITKALFYKSPELYALFFVAASLAIWLGIWSKQTAPVKLTVMIFLGVIAEIYIVRLISPFELRFFYHWQLFIPFILALPFSRWWDPWGRTHNAMIAAVWLLYASLLVGIAQPIMHKNLESTTDIEAISTHDRAYALGKTSFETWFAPMMPRVASVVSWCGQPRTQAVNLFVADPELIWNYEGLARAFLVTCRFQLIRDPQTRTMDEILSQLTSQNQPSYIFSAVSCGQADLVYTDPLKIRLAEINQALICNADSVAPLIYQLKE